MLRAPRIESRFHWPASLRGIRRATTSCILALACAGGRVDSEAQVPSVGYIAVLPGSATLAIGDSIRMEAVVLGPAGDTLRNIAVEWRSANSLIARISPAGYVHAMAAGLAGITAEIGGRTGSARVIVTPAGSPPQVARAESTQTEPPSAAPVKPAVPDSAKPRVAARPPRDAQARPAPRAPGVDLAALRRTGSEAHPHEPPGMRTLADRAFLTKAARDNDRGGRECRGGSECWDGAEHRYRNFQIVEDPSAPFSCCTIARMRYAEGHRSGTAPATVQTTGFKPQVQELYVSIRARLSENWHGNQSGTNKMFFLGLGRSGNNIFLSAEGVGSHALQPQIRLQGVPDQRARIRPNRAQRTITRGAWQHWEFYFRLNEPGVSNGIARMWIDGELVTDVSDVQFRDANQATRRWWIFHWSPTYGGGGAPVPEEQYLDFDHVYVSGR